MGEKRMSEPIWAPDVRPVPAELEPDYEHADYTPEPTITEVMDGIPIMDRLDEVMQQRLRDLFFSQAGNHG